jgi:hypothetical protein
MLFVWRRQLEESVIERLGKPSERIRRQILARQLDGFSDSSYLAQQIVVDKPRFWEYKLATELLRTNLKPSVVRWNALKRGLYVRTTTTISLADVSSWLAARFNETGKLAVAFGELTTNELPKAFGEPGEAGEPSEILRACALIVDCATRAIEWEEVIHFAIVPTEFEAVRALLPGLAGQIVDQFARIPIETAAIFEGDPTPGERHISLKVGIPEGWMERYHAELDRAVRLSTTRS